MNRLAAGGNLSVPSTSTLDGGSSPTLRSSAASFTRFPADWAPAETHQYKIPARPTHHVIAWNKDQRNAMQQRCRSKLTARQSSPIPIVVLPPKIWSPKAAKAAAQIRTIYIRTS